MDLLVSDSSLEVRPEINDQSVNQIRDLIETFKNRLTLHAFVKQQFHIL